MMRATDNLFIDIETTGTDDPVLIELITRSINPPGNYSKPETIAKWEAESKPGLVEKAIAETSLSGATGKVICVVYAVDDQAPVCLTGDERYILEMLMGLKAGVDIEHGCFPLVVGHNVADFDLRFLMQRCMVRGVQIGEWFPHQITHWSDRVFDTMTRWAGHRGRISLSDLAYAMDIPVNPTISGAEVPQAYAEGRMDDIIAHALEDVRVVREIYRRMDAVLRWQ